MALSTVAPRPAIYAHRFWSENDSSLFLQKKQCADFLGVDVFGYDYDLYEEVYDNHPVWAVLMENVRSGKINHVLVASSDRLSWSKDEIREVESELHKNNVRLTVVQDT
jgi:DNA invertase Pin-like site-specific DNA recombinase